MIIKSIALHTPTLKNIEGLLGSFNLLIKNGARTRLIVIYTDGKDSISPTYMDTIALEVLFAAFQLIDYRIIAEHLSIELVRKLITTDKDGNEVVIRS